MITSQELYESGFASSETKDDEIIYIEFSKFINGIEIQVTHEIVDGIVDQCYVEIGVDLSYRKLVNVDTIEKIFLLEKLLK